MNEDTLIVIIVFGSIFGIVLISLLFSLIKTWIKSNRNTFDEESFNRMANAFIKHKKETEQRLRRLEKQLPAKETDNADQSIPPKDQKNIKIETNKKDKNKDESSNTLKNILKE